MSEVGKRCEGNLGMRGHGHRKDSMETGEGEFLEERGGKHYFFPTVSLCYLTSLQPSPSSLPRPRQPRGKHKDTSSYSIWEAPRAGSTYLQVHVSSSFHFSGTMSVQRPCTICHLRTLSKVTIACQASGTPNSCHWEERGPHRQGMAP